MTEITKKELAILLQRMEILPNSPIQRGADLDQTVDTYFDILSDLTPTVLRVAVDAYLSQEKYFPTPSGLRQKAIEVALLSANVPTPAEAWGQIVRPVTVISTVRCKEGNRLRDSIEGKAGKDYWKAIEDYKKHVDNCADCYNNNESNQMHPAAKMALEAMGGEKALFTGMPTADRARFIEGYQAFLQRETMSLSLPQSVKAYIQKPDQKTFGEIKQLANKLTLKGS